MIDDPVIAADAAPDAVPAPVRDRIVLPDGEMAVLRWPAPDKPRLVFAHANGFCAGAARRMLANLATDFDVIAPDLRGHGRTRLPADPDRLETWAPHADDLLALQAALDRPADLVGGHSLGGAATLLAAHRMKTPVPLALVEPVAPPPAFCFFARTPLWPLFRRSLPISKTARRRGRAWPARSDVLERYRAKPNFARWAPGVLEDYLDDGLIETPDGVRLACDPDWEAANYEAQGNNLPGALKRLSVPVHVFKAEHGSTVINASGLERRGARIDAMDGVGHLAVMEQPERVAAWIRQVFKDTR